METMIRTLTSYDFLVVAAGTILLAVPSAIVGCLSVYKGQSLMADAIGQASYPGIVLAFMLFLTRNPFILTIGAACSGILSYALIQMITRGNHVTLDAALAIVLTGFFGLGMVLKSDVQGNPLYMHASQAGLKNYIFGSAAFLMKDDLLLIAICALIAMALFALFKKELISSIFDPDFSASIGIHTGITESILLLMMVLFLVVGLKCVGAILISSFLVMPCICANQHTRRLNRLLTIASVVAGISAFSGTLISTLVPGASTGPMIVLCMGALTVFSMLFGKCSVYAQNRRKGSRADA